MFRILRLKRFLRVGLTLLILFFSSFFPLFAEEINLPPVVKISCQPKEGLGPLEVQFSSEGTSDPEGDEISYYWTFGDGTHSAEANPKHLFNHPPAEYFVQLMVTDNRGLTTVSSPLRIKVKAVGENINKKRIVEFQEKQLSFVYKEQFRLKDLYRSGPYVRGEIDIAGTGFALAGLCIAVEHGLISRDKAQDFALATIKRCLELQNNPETNFSGFLYHFYLWDQVKEKFYHKPDVEVSTIDTALLLSGMLTSGEYFGGAIRDRAEEFYSKINWKRFFEPARRQFRMAWKNGNFFGWWDFYTDEILLIALLAVGAPNPEYRVFPEDAFSGFRVNFGKYNLGEKYVYSWWGALFTYLYAHIFLDFKRLGPDRFYRVDWWENTKRAIEADINYCRDEGYPENVWGLTACWSKSRPRWDEWEYRSDVGGGLSGEGLRYGNKKNEVWPIAPFITIACIPFFDLEDDLKNNPAFLAWDFMEKNIYNHEGFIVESLDANSLDKEGRPQQNSSFIVGMDVLTPVLMIENAFSGLIWEYFMRNYYVQKAIDIVFR
ncbi:MAG: PKD domain-containing protein [Candidatus Omnitrophica bacterium]|nr:PKD domain-containing protein [Candidatus Omnitrophota bacterium]